MEAGPEGKPDITSRAAWHRVEDAENFRPVPHHLAVTHLSPAEEAVAVDDERRAPGHVAVLVEDAVLADDTAVDVAQQGKRKAVGLA